MQSTIARPIRALLAASAFALAGACKGSEQRAAASDTPTVRVVDSTEALAYMAAVDQSEIEAAQFGARRATDTEVRQFAQLLWREHARSGRELAELARQMEIDLRAAGQSSPMVASLRASSQQTTQLLSRTPKSPAFDRTYIDSQVRAHQAVLQDLRRIVAGSQQRADTSIAPGGGVDVGVTGRPDVALASSDRRSTSRRAENAQEAARMMLGAVQQHLARARELQSKVAGSTSGPAAAATSSPPARSSAPAARPRAGARP